MDTNILQLRKKLDTFTMEELKKEIIRVKRISQSHTLKELKLFN